MNEEPMKGGEPEHDPNSANPRLREFDPTD